MAGLFERIRSGLGRTRKVVAERIATAVGGRRLDDDVLDEIEEILLTADVGMDTAAAVTDGLRTRAHDAGSDADVFDLLQAELEASLLPVPDTEITTLPHRPYVVLVVGVNGVGKTTTIGKLARRHAEAGHKVLLAACDTFRAGAVAQLDVWAQRAGVEIIKAQQGADPAAVVFDALQAAQSRGSDVVFIDTAGRLHNKVNLMEELKKVRRSIVRQCEGAPHDTLLVLDATTGQNALNQATQFNDAVGLTGLVLTKLDGTARGGIAFALGRETGVPIRWIGVGESIDDLQPFDGSQFVAALLGRDN